MRDYAWAATASPRHGVLIRRSLTEPSDLAFFYCHIPQGRPTTLPALVRAAGKQWPAEECLQQGKGQTGLDQHQVRTWHSFRRHTVLSMCAQALVAAVAALPARRGLPRRQPAGQPRHGAIPASYPPPPMTSHPATTPAWSRSAFPKPAAYSAWPPHR
jgi:SRSO17 transposase